MGQARARQEGARQSTGDILVYLDSHCEVRVEQYNATFDLELKLCKFYRDMMIEDSIITFILYESSKVVA